MNEYPPEYVEILAYTAWTIWNGKNLAYFNDKPFDAMGLIARSYSHWREYAEKEERGEKKICKANEVVKWKKPPEGKTKVNCDAAVLMNERVGLGFVMRNDRGDVILAGMKKVEAAGSSTLLEGLAIKYALQMIGQYNLQVDMVESDSKCCIDGLNGMIQTDMYSVEIAKDIKELAASVRCNGFEFIPRQGNRTAHFAAKGPEFISIRHTPEHLLEMLHTDVLN